MLSEFEGGTDMASARAAFHTWMFDRALPFWATAGQDAPGRGSREHLQLDGSAASVGYNRMHLSATGDAAANKIPTSSLYHVFMADGELQQSSGPQA